MVRLRWSVLGRPRGGAQFVPWWRHCTSLALTKIVARTRDGCWHRSVVRNLSIRCPFRGYISSTHYYRTLHRNWRRWFWFRTQIFYWCPVENLVHGNIASTSASDHSCCQHSATVALPQVLSTEFDRRNLLITLVICCFANTVSMTQKSNKRRATILLQCRYACLFSLIMSENFYVAVLGTSLRIESYQSCRFSVQDSQFGMLTQASVI